MRLARNPVTMWSLRGSLLLFLALLGGMLLVARKPPLTARNVQQVSEPASFPLDCYGGIPVQVSQATGSFRVEKVGNRWMFITPEGHPFWMIGVYAVDATSSIDDLRDSYNNRVIRKYGDRYTWAEQTARRLKSWGFNTLGEYATSYVLSTTAPYGGRSNPEKMPVVALISAAYYSLRNTYDWADGPVKDLVGALDSHYRGYRGATSPDIWDPNYEMWLDNALQKDPYAIAVLNSPWLLGIVCDDTDQLFGFGAGPDFATEPPGNTSPHLGWIILITPGTQASNARIGVTYRDRKVYSKYALRDFLADKYRTVGALNAAWNSTYTTFDSDGGWPDGQGLLDENGKGSWLGTDAFALSDARPQVKADLDDFLFEHAKKYFSLVRSRIKQHSPGNLYLGPTVIGSWRAPARKEILRAAGQSVDVINTHYNGSQETLDFMARYAGDVPISGWEGAMANPDSSLFRYKGLPGPLSFDTQADRGRFYAGQLANYFSRAVSTTGIKPIVGIKYWQFADNWGEKANWGLVSFLDNAYDGKEAVVAAGADPWSFPTGGEERDHGDFISAVRRANLALLEQLRNAATGRDETGGKKKKLDP